MSRIGKQKITIPSGVTITLNDETRIITVKGSKGELTQALHHLVSIVIDNNEVSFLVKNELDTQERALWGTTRALVANMVKGVTEGFKQSLELNGVGYRMELAKNLTLHIGFSHPVVVDIPEKIKLTLNKNVLEGESTDKQLIGDFFTTVHNLKPCEPYKHKGFKFPGRFYPKKEGKKGSK